MLLGGVALTVMKAEVGDHWPRLGKEKKNNRVRVNFDLWQAQAKEEEEEKAAALQQLKDELIRELGSSYTILWI